MAGKDWKPEQVEKARAILADDSGKYSEDFVRTVAGHLRDYEDEHGSAEDAAVGGPLPNAAAEPSQATSDIHETELAPIAIEGDPHAGEAGGMSGMFGAYAAKPADETPDDAAGKMSRTEALATGARNPFNLGDEAIGFGAKIADSGFGRGLAALAGIRSGRAEPEAAQPDLGRSEYQAARDSERDLQTQADTDHPGYYRGGQFGTEVAALAPSMLLGGGSVAAGRLGPGLANLAAKNAATAAGRTVGQAALRGVVNNAAQGAALSGLSGAGASEAEDAGGVIRDAASAMPAGALVGGGLGAIGAGARAVGTAAPGLHALASKMRGSATGAYGGELAQYVQQHGADSLEALGSAVERLGLHKRAPMPLPARAAIGGGVGAAAGYHYAPEGEEQSYALKGAGLGMGLSALAGLPATPAVYRENAARVSEQLGKTIGETLTEAGAQGVSVPRQTVLNRLYGVKGANPDVFAKTTAEGLAARDKIDEIGRLVREEHSGPLSPTQLHQLKKNYEYQAGFKPNKNTSSGDAAKHQIYSAAAGAPRGALHDAMETQALPETAERFSSANRDYGYAQAVENFAGKREAQEAGNQMMSLPTAIGMSTEHPVGAFSVEGVKRIGKDASATGLRALANMSQRIGNAGANAPPLASTVNRAANTVMQPSMQPALLSFAPSMAQSETPESQDTGPRIAQRGDMASTSRGHEVASVVRARLESSPESFGQYKDQLSAALDSGDDDLETAIHKLSAANPDFRVLVQRMQQENGR